MKANLSLSPLNKTSGLFLIILCLSIGALAQNLYTARGYWQESTKSSYLTIKEKKEEGQSLTADEEAYVQDYEAYLLTYYNRLTEEEKQTYQRMKDQWDRELAMPLVAPVAPQQQQIEQAEFEWRNRDRVANFFYGAYYGTSLVVITGMESAAAAGVPLITGGIWLLGPAMNPKKYEGITQTTVNASNAGKFLGVINGWALSLAVAGESSELDKIGLGISTIGSIALGEYGFQAQKKRNISAGNVAIIRHYGVLGPLVGASVLAATNTENANLIGVGLLAGSVAGIALGNKTYKKYDYSQGDVDAISSLSLISTGLGFAVVSDALINSSEPSNALLLIPAATAVAGTLLGQRSVKNLYLTKRQGSTINLSALGGALVGVGVLAIAEAESPIAWVGVPSVLALVMHQAVFTKYKKDNLANGLKGQNNKSKKVDFSMKLMPENYFVNKQMSARLSADPRLPAASPLVNMTLKFK